MTLPDRRLLIILSFTLLFALAVGGWTVLVRSSQRFEPSTSETAPLTVPTAEDVSPQTSKVVLDETKTSSGETFKAVSGNLLSVEGRVLILEVENDRLKILVSLDANIMRTTLPAAAGDSPTVTEITLADLEIGQRVDALVRINVEGTAITTNINMIR